MTDPNAGPEEQARQEVEAKQGERNPLALLELRASSGTLIWDGIVIGGIGFDMEGLEEADNMAAAHEARPVLWLNLGWMKAAGVGINIQNDPAMDRSRSGSVLER